MGHLERGEKNVSFSTLTKVAGALSVGISELFAGVETGDVNATVQAQPPTRRTASGRTLDRERMLKELAVLERGVRSLKEMALAAWDEQPRPRRTTALKTSRSKPS
jgi:transcriptional regulator with XRE-family HTH domain